MKLNPPPTETVFSGNLITEYGLQLTLRFAPLFTVSVLQHALMEAMESIK
jgi:hypothetical protein